VLILAQRYVADFYDTRSATKAVKTLDGLQVGQALLVARLNLSDRSSYARMRETGPVYSDTSEFTLGSAAYHPSSFRRRDSIPSVNPLTPDTSSYSAYNLDPFLSTSQGSQASQDRPPIAPCTIQYPIWSPPRQKLAPTSTFMKHRSLPASARYDTFERNHDGNRQYDDLSSELVGMERRMSEPGGLRGLHDRMDTRVRARAGQGLGGPWIPNDRKRIPEENRVFPDRILSGTFGTSGEVISDAPLGLDSRTTVMIKDVPVSLLTPSETRG
jgi:hypothetical protein